MIYFLSDAHLGSRVIQDHQAHQQTLVSLLKQMQKDATEVFLLGDIFDFWYEYALPDASKELFRPTLNVLKSLTSHGIRVHFFIGNHDIWTFGWLAKQTGVIIHRQPIEIEIANKRILLAHGDGLVPQQYLNQLPKSIQRKIRHFIYLRAFFHHPIPQYLFRLIPPRLGNQLGYEWARKSRMKELKKPFPYKGEQQEELVLYAKEQERMGKHHDLYIFGHRHIELDLLLSANSRILLLGDFFKQWTYAEMTEQGEISLCNVDNINPVLLTQ